MKSGVRLLIALCVTLLLAGCGGWVGSRLGSGTSSTLSRGKAEIRFVWPERSRLIPLAANSVRLRLSNANQTYTQVVNRPTATGSNTTPIVFDPVDIGDYTVTAEAFPQADATGTVQASGTTTLSVLQGQNTSFTVTMLSQVATVTVSGPSTTILVGDNKVFSAKAFNAANVEVLVDDTTWQWTAPTGVKVVSLPGGQVRIKALEEVTGSVTATYTEPESDDPVGTVAYESLNPIYQINSFLTAGASDASDDRTAVDIVGDSTANIMSVFQTQSDTNTQIWNTTEREFPAWVSTPALSFTGTATPLALATNSNGRQFVAVQIGATAELWSADRGVGFAKRYNLQGSVLDIAAGDDGRVYVLADEAGTKRIRRYETSGTSTILTATLDSKSTRIGADGFGNVYYNGTDIRVQSATGTETVIMAAFPEEVLDIDATDGNVYVMATPDAADKATAHVVVYTAEGDLLDDISTQAFFYEFDLSTRFAVDKQTGDFYLLRVFEDFTLWKGFEVVSFFRF